MQHLLAVAIALSAVFALTGPDACAEGGVERQTGGEIMVQDQPLPATAFPLSAVQLLDGPFLEAQNRGAAYLLQLEPDRLLANFRSNAGLEPRAEHYGGWEQQGVSGHTLGHYLSACALGYASTRDDRFLERCRYIVAELAACQEAKGTGYVGAIPDGDRIWAEIAAGDIRTQGFDLNGGWVPWYTMHKLFAGLVDAYRLCGTAEAKDVAVKLADWACEVTKGLDDDQFQTMLVCEHGGINEALANVYAISGDPRHLALAQRFHHHAILDPLEEGRDELAGRHANTQIPKFVGCARLYELTGDPRYRAIAWNSWDRVANHHSYVTGGHSIDEHFGQPDRLNDRLGPTTAETCNVYNMLKLTHHVFRAEPDGAVGDFLERALYNHILASQEPEEGRVTYFLSLEQGGEKEYQRQFDAFTCCVGTGMENHVRYGESIYFHDADGIWVNLYIASELTWAEQGLALRQETRFPDEDTSQFTLALDAPKPLTLRFRVPHWTHPGVSIEVNGVPTPVVVERGFAVVSRTWEDGDRIAVRLPMRLRTEAMPDNPNRAAVLYGPIVLAGLVPADVAPEDWSPTLVTEGRPVHAWTAPADGPLTFETQGVGRPKDTTLIPFFRTHHQRYTVYWDFMTSSQWEQFRAELAAEAARLRELEARTIDFFQPGEMQPERDHAFEGENTAAGRHQGVGFRHAPDGWFSFTMAVSPDRPVDLVCTYWGSDVGLREFDILVDDEVVATESLNNPAPGDFVDIAYSLPRDLTAGKERVTVRLQAKPGNTAGGLFGCRTVLRTAE